MFVARAGLDHPDLALPLLAGLTPRWSSEWPLRPFLETHPEVTYGYLERWVTDPDEHVRRLVSEGTRPRLPWASRLRASVEDPRRGASLLEPLVDDPSPLVRRSVANHLNDISKDHPDLAVEMARRWLARGEAAAWTVRHGLRTLVKSGDPEALEVVGVSTDAQVEVVGFGVTPLTVSIGESVALTISVALPDTAEEADVVIDYRVHHQGARGRRAPKVFKITRRHLAPSRPQTITKEHRFEHLSIRRIYPGPHIIDVQVNGTVVRCATVEVLDS